MPGKVNFTLTRVHLSGNKGKCLSVFQTYNMDYWLIKLFFIYLFRVSSFDFYALLQLSLCSDQISKLFLRKKNKKKKKNHKAKHMLLRKRKAHLLWHRLALWWFFQNVRYYFLSIFYLYVVSCKTEAFSTCCHGRNGGLLMGFICNYFFVFFFGGQGVLLIWKHGLPIYKMWAMGHENATQKIITLREENCPTATLVKLNAMTNASSYPPLLIAIKCLFASTLMLSKLISALMSAEVKIY